jgi:hypothetical protein
VQIHPRVENIESAQPLVDHGIRRSNCSTTARPAPVIVTDVGRVDPSVDATSAPLDETSNFLMIARGWMSSVVPVFSTMLPSLVMFSPFRQWP